MLDYIAYVFVADQQFVVLLHRWFSISQWYIIYPLAMLHTSAWVLVKIGILRMATVTVQRRAARRREARIAYAIADTRVRRLLRRFGRTVVMLAHRAYASAKRAAHGKSVNGYSLFLIGLTPLFQKLGDAIIGISWERFGWRSVGALCAGASLQAGCFCLLYSIYGKAKAGQLMLWIMLPLGVIMLLTWLFKNGRSKSA